MLVCIDEMFFFSGALQVECPKYPGFCITRQKKEYPFIEIFHSPIQVWCSLPVHHYLITSLHKFPTG